MEANLFIDNGLERCQQKVPMAENFTRLSILISDKIDLKGDYKR